jgi:hypothetical protein
LTRSRGAATLVRLESRSAMNVVGYITNLNLTRYCSTLGMPNLVGRPTQLNARSWINNCR